MVCPKKITSRAFGFLVEDIYGDSHLTFHEVKPEIGMRDSVAVRCGKCNEKFYCKVRPILREQINHKCKSEQT